MVLPHNCIKTRFFDTMNNECLRQTSKLFIYLALSPTSMRLFNIALNRNRRGTPVTLPQYLKPIRHII